ncbi:hypothetical protein [Streptomyces sp. CB01881]|uniref:hypothetical protein n=1 Tax=Streptomyces sp. CB01881 TaxID=2078691 RepID=UPI0011DFF4F0|nr:hypothetical protein [Streptomyces sp. CB01881]TYC76582.1 hypothetical protein EH183_02960 [Streptomyces sp. CB01881]
MSDGLDLAATAVGIISAAAGSAAAGIGTAAGRLVTDLVRSRLQSVPDGPDAVTAVEDNPQDPSAQARLTDVLAQALAADPDFRAALAQNVSLSRTVPPPPPPGSINIGAGATVKNSNFALRDVVVNHIRHTNNSTLAIYAIGLVVLLALAAYGGANLLADTDSPSPGRAAASQGQAASPPTAADPGQPSATTAPSPPHGAATLADPALGHPAGPGRHATGVDARRRRARRSQLPRVRGRGQVHRAGFALVRGQLLQQHRQGEGGLRGPRVRSGPQHPAGHARRR